MSSVSAPSDQLDAPVAPPPQTRSCLRCHDDFLSEWSGERICKRCKGTAAWREGGTISSHSSAGF